MTLKDRLLQSMFLTDKKRSLLWATNKSGHGGPAVMDMSYNP